ncbi:partial tRNA(Glu)-specific nuclease WapA, partial [Anaerolineae bacterium]
VDTYARLNTQQSVYYRDLTSSTHTLTLQVLNTKHLYSNGTKFNLDYFDVWDGTDITTGTFETPFATTWNWNDLASGAASGGRYYSAVYVNNAMWQAFTGDSINYQGLATTNQGEVEIQIDGQVRGYINLKDSSSITRPVSFGNLGAGPHVLQVRAYRNTPTVDAFITPGSAPYYEPPTRSGVIRYEEDDPAIRYGLNAPYLQMPQVWEAINDGALASDGYYVRTNSVGQTVTLPFTGTWVGFGYIATSNSGQITLTLDGVQLGVLDAYAPTTMQRGWYTAGLSSGVHTLTLKLSPIRNAGSSGTYFNFDYFDQWDGSLLPAGRFETPFATTWNWTEYTSGIASGGSYYSAGSSNAMWHAFTSDAVTYQALTVNGAVTAEVSIDGITRGLVSLYHPTVITRTFDYSGLGVGPHVLQVRAANGAATVDAFITPSFYPTATQRTVITYAYDPLYRLTQANATGALTYTFAYDYDAVGNRTAQTQTITSTQVTAYQYDAANRLASVDGQAYTWDDNGNLVNDGEKTYTYNQANRLTDLTQGETTYQFNYNGDGVRLRQMIAGVPTTYTQDLATPLPVVLQSQAGESTMQYVYALGTRPLAQYGSAWEYLLADALGSVRQIVDEDGDVTLAESYEPYGSVLSSTGAASSIFGYSGEETDTSGLVYLRARYMNPMLGIFLARDPWSGDQMRPGSMNGYSYAYANPIKYTDPSGWITEDEATRPGGADEIVEGLLQTYHVRIVKDWGFVPVRDQPGLGPGVPILPTCSLWTEGNWRKIDELEWIAESVHIVATGLGGNEKIQSALGSELKLIRLKHSGSFAPPGILSWVFGGDIVLGDDIGGDEIFTKGTIPHEFAHVWDYRTQNQLSKGLMEALGTWVCSGTQCAWNPFAKHFDPVTNSYVYPERAPGSNPRCLKAGPPDPSVPDCQETSYANTYGDAPVFTGPGWEDWATSFEAFVYPERLLNYRLQTALVNGGVREAYVRGKINDIP